ncbi:MAG: rhamnulokinase [Planctomycetes bacterium]|nr:rhamnulokinase [Planctomycetota bacterium]
MPNSDQVFLAVDLGASSGRLVAGRLRQDRLELDEVHRFDNGGVAIDDRLYWDLPRLWTSILDGLRAAAAKYGNRIRSVGVDTWGVDFGLLDRNNELLGNPYCYRDRRTAGVLDLATGVISRDEIFEETGLQFMEFNTLFQLFAMRRQQAPVLEIADRFLMIPDLFHWLLSGEKINEYTNATTSQIYNPRTRGWSERLIERFGLPRAIFGPIVEPGTNLGSLRPSVADESGLHGVRVIVPGTHDTASAVMAVPAGGSASSPTPDWCYISSGTWSLMGVEVPAPVINATCRQLNFTNEGGVNGTTRLLKNIAGLWLVQECRRVWKQAGRDYDWAHLVRLAEAAPALRSLINPDHPSLVAPSDMPDAIRQLCRANGEPIPESEGAVIRCALESLALRYRMVLGWLEKLTGGALATVHIVGGGSQNTLLNQWTADACQRRVLAGPVEATAIGNLLVQIISTGNAGSTHQGREIVGRSFPVNEFLPQPAEPWESAYSRFQRLVGS